MHRCCPRPRDDSRLFYRHELQHVGACSVTEGLCIQALRYNAGGMKGPKGDEYGGELRLWRAVLGKQAGMSSQSEHVRCSIDGRKGANALPWAGCWRSCPVTTSDREMRVSSSYALEDALEHSSKVVMVLASSRLSCSSSSPSRTSVPSIGHCASHTLYGHSAPRCVKIGAAS